MNNNEPIVTTAAVVAGVTAVIALLAAFGVPLTADQQVAILGVVGVAAPFIVAFIARKFTVSLNRVGAYETKSGNVVAGPAAVQPDGTPVTVESDPSVGTIEASGLDDPSHPPVLED